MLFLQCNYFEIGHWNQEYMFSDTTRDIFIIIADRERNTSERNETYPLLQNPQSSDQRNQKVSQLMIAFR